MGCLIMLYIFIFNRRIDLDALFLGLLKGDILTQKFLKSFHLLIFPRFAIFITGTIHQSEIQILIYPMP